MSKLFENVNYLSISFNNGQSDSWLYANGENQVPVTIVFMVTDANYQQVILTEQQIAQCVFIGDYFTNTPFPINPGDGWFMSRGANQFVTSGLLNSTNQQVENAQALDAASDYQSVTLYVVNDKYSASSRTLCAYLTPDNNNTWFTSGKGTPFDNGVTISALPPVVYDVLDLKLQRVDAKSWDVNGHHVDQDDYYVSITSSLTTAQFKVIGFDNPSMEHFYEQTADSTITYQYCFQVGDPATMTITLDDNTKIPIDYNQRPGQISATRVTVSNARSYSYYDEDCRFKAFDQYGNWGYVYLHPANYGKIIEIYNA
nr:hypothetical protein [uncultured Enterobacter sp.]